MSTKRTLETLLFEYALAGLLASVVVGAVVHAYSSDSSARAKWSKARVEMGEITKALADYMKTHGGTYPQGLNVLEQTNFPNGLPKDPFTRDDYIYKRNASGFFLVSLGNDLKPGGDGTDRDIIYTESGLQEPSP